MANTQMMMTKGYLVLSAIGIKTRKVEVNDAAQAVAIWSQFRDSNGFGGSDLKRDSGNLIDAAGRKIARVMYNGRIRDCDDNLIYDPYSEVV